MSDTFANLLIERHADGSQTWPPSSTRWSMTTRSAA